MKTLTFALFLSINLTFNGYGQSSTGNYLYRCNEKLTEIIMEDVFNPPQASRVHAYPNIAAYEVLCKKYKTLHSLAGQLNELKPVDKPSGKVDYSLSALAAFSSVARYLVYSEFIIDDFEKKEFNDWMLSNKGDSGLFRSSVDYGNKVAEHIIAWIKKDNYNYTRTLSRYVLSDTAGAWRPTAPDYMTALEPNWPLMRSLVMDSSANIRSIPAIEYSEDKNSAYFKYAMDLYKQSQQLDSVQKLIANFWDCNPNITKSAGHMMYFIHKVSPGGHWVRITGQACKNLGFDEYKTTQVYTMLTIGLYEAFLACWKVKYTANGLRPETYINKLIAPKWLPYIETPPFPEYTSAHSTMSSVSATILTALVPQPYEFTDSSEMYIDLPPRHFKSFREASNEASISRFYGGIHYMPALDNAILHGKDIGNYILRKIKLTEK